MSTSAEENKRVMQSYLDALSGSPKTVELLDRFVDSPALRQHILETEASFPNYELIVHQMVAEGDTVAINATMKAVQKGMFAGIPPTGKHVSVGAMVFYRLADGRIVDFAMQADMLGGLNQLKS